MVDGQPSGKVILIANKEKTFERKVLFYTGRQKKVFKLNTNPITSSIKQNHNNKTIKQKSSKAEINMKSSIKQIPTEESSDFFSN